VPLLPAPLGPPDSDDFGLMAALREGDPTAFERLAARWRPRLVNFFLSLGADCYGADDCAQETLLRVYRYRDAYRPDVPFAGFLFTLGRRAFLDGRRRAKRYESRTSPLPADEPGLAPPVADGTAAHADRLDLAAAVATLPRRLRDVVELAVLRGLPYHRVAALLGIPVGTVKSRMHHAVRQLRGVLGDGTDGAPPA
jgi:RNA polymerase sigma factor (sigma-70 family)